MLITRTEPTTGGRNRTRREEITQLFTGTRKVEAEQYLDCSQSTGWAWDSNPKICTWTVQIAAVKAFTAPFAALDAEGDGIFTYPFNHQYLPLDPDPEEGDVNPDNIDAKLAAFYKRYRQFFRGGIPVAGGTAVMEAVRAADKRYLGEFPDTVGDRRVRGRVLWTDGELQDAAEFMAYLADARLGTVPDVDQGLGVRKDWDEAWAVAILGEAGGGGQAAYEQYRGIAKLHPWVHPYYFENVTAHDEIGEDMALAVVPAAA